MLMALTEIGLNFEDFKSGGLCEMHAEVTRYLAVVSAFA
jgi:hypothetical protein